MNKKNSLKSKKTYIYRGYNQKNHVISGEIDAIDIVNAKSILEKRGISIKKIKKRPIDILPKRIKYSHITSILNQLSVMSSAGVPIIRAFDIVVLSIKKHYLLKKMLISIKESIESGNSLSDSIKAYPQYFDNLSYGLIRAGERSGTLDIMLERISKHRENIEDIRKKVKKALTYPIIVSLIAVGVTAILLIFAVPAFSSVFISSGHDLPKITKLTIYMSDFMLNNWWKIVLVLFLSILGFKYARKRNVKFNHFIDLLMIKMPVFGSIIEKSSLARFAKTLATTSSAGMNLIEALETISKSIGNWKYENAVNKIIEYVSQGNSIFESATQTGVFPPMFLQMIAVGEESGQLDKMLCNIAKVYESEVEIIVNTMSSTLEPIIMVFLGGVVGFLVVSMYMPIFELGNTL